MKKNKKKNKMKSLNLLLKLLRKCDQVQTYLTLKKKLIRNKQM